MRRRRTTRYYQVVHADFGLTFSIPKMKQMVAGRVVKEDDRMPVVDVLRWWRSFPIWVLW